THRCGLQPGDRVALAMSNSPEYIEVLYAVWHAGLTAVPMNAKLHQREFAYILENSGARLCFATPDLVETVAPLTQEIAGLKTVGATVPGRLYRRGHGHARRGALMPPPGFSIRAARQGGPKGRC